MKHYFYLLILIPIFSFAQNENEIKLINFKELQKLLPGDDFKGFKREKPEGETSTMMGFGLSNANVQYTKINDESDMYFEVSINDFALMQMMFTPFYTMLEGFYSENEDGYSKAFKYKEKYHGILHLTSTEDMKSVDLQVSVIDRFVVSVRLYNSDDVDLAHKIMDKIKIEELETLVKN